MRNAVIHMVTRSTSLALVLVLAIVLSAAASCSDSRRPGDATDAGSIVIGRDAGATDAGSPDAARLDPDAARPDAGLVDAGAPDANLPDADVPDADVGDDPCGLGTGGPIVSTSSGPADFSCLGAPRASGAVADITLRATDFQTGDVVDAVEVHAFVDGRMVDGACVAPDCIVATTPASGLIAARAHAPGELAYRMLRHMGPTSASTRVETFGYGIDIAAAGDTVSGAGLSLATMNLVPTILGFRRSTGTATVMGVAHDCAGRPVSGLRACVVADGVPVLEGVAGADPHYRYFNGDSFPSPTATETAIDGLFGAYNLPVPAAGSWGDITVYGRLPADAAPRALFHTRARLGADAVTLITQRP